MNPYQTILVAAALDRRDDMTMRHAATFAHATGAGALVLAHVCRATEEDLPAAATVALQAELEQFVRVLANHRGPLFPSTVRIESIVRQGSLVLELARVAAQKSADLLILARRPVAEHDLLSEAALQLVRKAPCSVFLLPPESEPHYQRILVPVDFSDHSREALELACVLARHQPNTAITVQHTYEVPMGWHKSGYSHDQLAARFKKNAEERWARFATEVDLTGINCVARYDFGDNIPKTILDVSEKMDASLIVLGSHGRTRPAEVLLGHVADIVCSRTSRPVLCVKKKGEVVNLLQALLQMFEFERT